MEIPDGSLLWAIAKLWLTKGELGIDKISGQSPDKTVEIKIYDMGTNQTRIVLIQKG